LFFGAAHGAGATAVVAAARPFAAEKRCGMRAGAGGSRPYGSGSNPLPRNESVEAPVEEEGDSLSSAISKLFSEYNSFVNESKTKEGNAFGKAVADAKKDGVQKGEKVKVGGKEYSVKEAGEKTMSRAAKGNEKYGKAGMQALAKAGREGKSLDKVRDKYNKYD
jgi:hypothetical protein